VRDQTDRVEISPATTRLSLVLIVALWGLLRIAFGSSISGNDDIAIAGCAIELSANGLYIPESHYCARWGLTLPLATIFRLLGPGAFQMSLLPALASFAALLLAWRLGSLLIGPLAGLAAAFTLAVFPMDVAMAGLLFPDMIQGALMSAAILCLLHGKGRGVIWPVAAGVFWGWAYYVKIDSAVLVFVIGLGWLFGFVTLPAAVIAGLVALVLVGIELLAYGLYAGDPLLQLHLVSAGLNEVLAAGHDYRQLLILPKAMFLVPYQAGLFFYAWLLGLGLALWSRSRAVLFIAGWSLLWLLWLIFGADPFSGFRLRPQLERYLLSFSIPAAVLVGWGWSVLWRTARPIAWAAPVSMLAAIALFGPFNRLSYEASAATQRGVSAALENHWFPLCPDVQSRGIVQLLLHGRPEAAQICTVQEHDFLKGQTRFSPPPSLPAYLLVNEDYARRLQVRNLVQPIDPSRFGNTVAQVWRVDNPLPATSYGALALLSSAASVVPGLGPRMAKTAADVYQGSDAVIWRVEGIPRAP